MIRTSILSFLLIALSSTAFAGVDDDEEALQKRIKARSSQIESLKDDGKIGETRDATVAAVKSEYLDDTITFEKKKITIEDFLKAENDDRDAVFELVAKRTKATKAAVVKRYATRSFKSADAEHWLRTDDGKWVQKKKLDEEK